MDTVGIHEYRHRYDSYVANEVLEDCVSKNAPLILMHQSKEFFSRVLRFDLESRTPFVVLDSLMPEEGNLLAKKRTEVGVKCHYLHKGSLYHVRFHAILWGVGEEKGLRAVLSTPPLDIKIASEAFVARPTRRKPLWVKIPLFREELRLEVTRIGVKGLTFEDRLLSDSLPALSNLGRIHIDFGDETEIVIPGDFRGRGGNTVEFRFEEVPEEALSIIEAYLEDVYSTQSTLKPGEKEERSEERMRRARVKMVKVLMLTGDKAYASRLQQLFQGKEIEIVSKDQVDGFYEEGVKQHRDVLLVDGTFEGLDLWQVGRRLKDLNKKTEEAARSPVVVLSDDLTEDYVVYAQYCGMTHVFGRKAFLESALKDIGSLIGRREWVGGEEGGGKVVVVIDDDRNVVYPLEHALSQQGYSPIVASNGGEGVRSAKVHRPSCIVLEVAVRSGDGMDACRMLKKMPFTRDVPVLVLTASRDEKDKQEALKAGVEAYLVKPVETSAVVAKIRELIGSPK